MPVMRVSRLVAVFKRSVERCWVEKSAIDIEKGTEDFVRHQRWLLRFWAALGWKVSNPNLLMLREWK